MTKAERTPGPWAVIPNDDARSWDVWALDLSIEAPICDVLSEANARFISAAPDMEKALEVISGSPHGANCDGFGARKIRFQCSCHVLMAKAALAKARGSK